MSAFAFFFLSRTSILSLRVGGLFCGELVIDEGDKEIFKFRARILPAAPAKHVLDRSCANFMPGNKFMSLLSSLFSEVTTRFYANMSLCSFFISLIPTRIMALIAALHVLALVTV